MNQNNTHLNKINKKLFFGICMFVFVLCFAHMISQEWKMIFSKDLYFQDESSNSVVSANLTRKIFPAMIRTNPLVQTPGDWMEGPYWQHIPPLFAYIPLPFFAIDNHISIEIKRLSYAFFVLLTGILFISIVHLYKKNIISTAVATIASILFVLTFITKNLINGRVFGTSDILLAFVMTLSFGFVLWYLNKDQNERRKYSISKLIITSIIVALPIITKNMLGAIPAFTFFVLLLIDQKRINKKVFLSTVCFLGVLLLYFFPLYISSPTTFKKEILLPISFFKNYEDWARPWHFFITNYIPFYYTRELSFFYYLGILCGLWILIKNKIDKKTKTILALSISWFLLNLLGVSMVRSKSPNLIFQTYLFSLFFAIYVPILFLSQINWQKLYTKIQNVYTKKIILINRALICVFVVLVCTSFYSYTNLILQIPKTRAQNYDYKSTKEKFYRFAEIEQKYGANTNDLFVLDSSKDNCWFRYYTLFLTGAESRAFTEIINYNVPFDDIKNKYKRIFFVLDASKNIPSEIKIPYKIQNTEDFQVIILDTQFLDNNYINTLKSFVISLHQKIYVSKSNCFFDEWQDS